MKLGSLSWYSYRLEGGGSIPGTGKRFLHSVHTVSGVHPATSPTGTGAIYIWVKRPDRDADHSPSSSAAVKSGVELYHHCPYVFLEWCYIK
jgi:hypothetical protein